MDRTRSVNSAPCRFQRKRTTANKVIAAVMMTMPSVAPGIVC
jgi:hypothetical protein